MKEQERLKVIEKVRQRTKTKIDRMKVRTERKQQTTPYQTLLFVCNVSFLFCLVFFTSFLHCVSHGTPCMWNERRTMNWCSMENAAALKQPLLLLRIDDVNSWANDQIMSIAASIQICAPARVCIKPLSFCVFCFLFANGHHHHHHHRPEQKRFPSNHVIAIILDGLLSFSLPSFAQQQRKNTTLNIAFITMDFCADA